jgi:phosphomannomutase/phosphoglucomutase
MKINPFIFRNYDIRGKVPEDLDPENVEALGKSFGTFLQKRKIYQAVIGRDCRTSGEEFEAAYIRGLLSTGTNVIDLGMVLTQMVYYAQYRYQSNGGTMITASHNPANYNGFKMCIGYSKTTEENEIAEIKKAVEDDKYYVADKPGELTKADVTEDYIADVLKRVRFSRKFKVVVDSHHGTTGKYMPEILRRAGCEVVEINTNIDGTFPAGTPDPTDANLMGNLANLTKENGAEIGLAYDGDGDRMGVVDDQGRILWNDVLVAIFAQSILERFPGSKIVYNTLCSQIVREVVKKNNGTPIIWKTGHAFIKSKIASESAAFGGELSGHFFFADNAYGHDDGAYATLRLLEYLTEKNMSLAQLLDTFPKYISSPEIKIGCPDDKKKEVITQLSVKFKAEFPNAEITDDTKIPGDDGVRADFADGMIVFRYSQNGPYITIKFEAEDQKTYDERKIYVRDLLKQYPDMIWEDELCVNLDVLN